MNLITNDNYNDFSKKDLFDRIIELNREASLEVITRIEAQAPESGQCLRDLVENFQMGRISKLLKKNGRSSL